jgi:hypothetical protein
MYLKDIFSKEPFKQYAISTRSGYYKAETNKRLGTSMHCMESVLFKENDRKNIFILIILMLPLDVKEFYDVNAYKC